MLDQVTITAEGEPVEMRHNQAIKLTEHEAREYLDRWRSGGARPSIREMAKLWGWAPATAGRFVQAFDVETKPVVSAVSRPSARPEPETEENFDWSAANPDLVVPHQPAIAVYGNPFGQIIIRTENTDFGSCEEDRFVQITPHHLPAVIRKLQAVAAEIEADK